MNKVALLGYSGHALVAADILLQAGYVIEGYLEKTEVSSNLLNIPYLGFELNKADRDKIKGILVFPAIGDNTIRAQVMIFMRKEGFIIPSAVSTKANISKNVNIDFRELLLIQVRLLNMNVRLRVMFILPQEQYLPEML
jgi:hypothetical protein